MHCVLLAGLSSRGADGGFKSFYTGSLSRFVHAVICNSFFQTKANTQSLTDFDSNAYSTAIPTVLQTSFPALLQHTVCSYQVILNALTSWFTCV